MIASGKLKPRISEDLAPPQDDKLLWSLLKAGPTITAILIPQHVLPEVMELCRFLLRLRAPRSCSRYRLQVAIALDNDDSGRKSS